MSINTSSGSEAKVYTYIAAFSAVLYSVLLVAPVTASLLGAQFHLSESQIGFVGTVELGSFSIATVPAFLWLRKANIRWVTLGCTILVVLGGIASGLVDSYPMLLVVRAVTCLAAGSITVIILSLSAKTRNPARSYGVFVVCQLAMGAIILFLFPHLFADRDVAAVYWTLAGLAVLCLPVAWCVKGGELKASSAAVVKVTKNVRGFICALIAVLGFYTALGGVWTFLAQIGVHGGQSLGTTSTQIAIATVFGVASSLLGTIVGEHRAVKLFIFAGYAVMAASMFLLFGAPGAVRFTVAAILFKIAWSWLLPYLLGAVSRMGGPMVMNSTNLMIGGGLAIGPALAGLIIEGTGGFAIMLVVSLCILGAAVLASTVVLRSAGAVTETADASAAPAKV
jgi:predicted MFS family arabinose efflux permease